MTDRANTLEQVSLDAFFFNVYRILAKGLFQENPLLVSMSMFRNEKHMKLKIAFHFLSKSEIC